MPTEAAVRCGPVERTYPELHDRVARLASALHALGVARGDRVALVLQNDVAFVEISLAAGRLGAVPVPVNWHWRGGELHHLLGDCEAVVVFAHSQLIDVVDSAVEPGVPVVEVLVPDELARAYGIEAPAPSGRHDDLDSLIAAAEPWPEPPQPAPLAMIYTSGTTGRPKGVLRNPMRPEDAPRLIEFVFGAFGLRPDSRTLLPAPLYHTAPNTHTILAAAAGLDITIMPRFDAEHMLQLIERYRIDETQVVPTMFIRLLQLPDEVRARYDISSLRAVVHAAAPCPPEVKRRMIDWLGPVVLEYYGGTETGIAVWCDSAQWLAHPGTVGAPLAGSDLRVLGADDRPVAPGVSGEVFLKPPPFWPDFTYKGLPERRAAIERDGHISVGDIGYVDEDGFLYLNDRASDMVISGGVNIYPAEIEQTLLQLPGVRDVAVFGIPDDEFGEALAAHVDTDPDGGPDEVAIRTFLRETIAGYKVPKIIVIDRDLPREDTGKLFKRVLRERYRGAATA